MKLELDLNTIKRNAKRWEDKNWRFRSFLKMQDPDKIDEIVAGIYEKVLEGVDCTECGNCCIELETCFNGDEIDRMTTALGIDKQKFIKESTKPDEFGAKDKFYLNSKPCKFLKDKKCTIYELRPEECSSYPYLHKEGFTSRLFGVMQNYELCPIVYNVYEMLKQRFNYR